MRYSVVVCVLAVACLGLTLGARGRQTNHFRGRRNVESFNADEEKAEFITEDQNERPNQRREYREWRLHNPKRNFDQNEEDVQIFGRRGRMFRKSGHENQFIQGRRGPRVNLDEEKVIRRQCDGSGKCKQRKEANYDDKEERVRPSGRGQMWDKCCQAGKRFQRENEDERRQGRDFAEGGRGGNRKRQQRFLGKGQQREFLGNSGKADGFGQQIRKQKQTRHRQGRNYT